MRKHRVALVGMIVAFLISGVAQPHLVAHPKAPGLKARAASQKENLAHARYVCNHGANYNKRWSCQAVKWLTREYTETRSQLSPKRLSVYEQARREAARQGIVGYEWDCLSALITRENGHDPASWSTTQWNSQGSSAYGLPQALPGSKMASAGPDWETDAATQVRWMIGYAHGSYGGVCQADSYQRSNNYY